MHVLFQYMYYFFIIQRMLATNFLKHSTVGQNLLETTKSKVELIKLEMRATKFYDS